MSTDESETWGESKYGVIDCDGVSAKEAYEALREHFNFDGESKGNPGDIRVMETDKGFKLVRSVERKLDEVHGE